MLYIYAYMVVLQSLSLVRFLQPLFCTWPDSSVHGISWARILEWVSISFSRELPDQKLESRSPALQVDSLLTELCREPRICIDRQMYSHTYTKGADGVQWVCTRLCHLSQVQLRVTTTRTRTELFHHLKLRVENPGQVFIKYKLCFPAGR